MSSLNPIDDEMNSINNMIKKHAARASDLKKEIMRGHIKKFRTIMLPINNYSCPVCKIDRGCRINCQWLAGVLDDKLDELYLTKRLLTHTTKHYGLGPIIITINRSKKTYTLSIAPPKKDSPEFWKYAAAALQRITRSLEPNIILKERDSDIKARKESKETMEKKTLAEGNHDDIRNDDADGKQSLLKQKYVGKYLTKKQIFPEIRKLPRRNDGTTKGFLVFYKPNPPRAHVINFFCDSVINGNYIYFLDAQADPNHKYFINLLPDTDGWEIFGIIPTVSKIDLRSTVDLPSTMNISLEEATRTTNIEAFKNFFDLHPEALLLKSAGHDLDTIATYLFKINFYVIFEDLFLEKIKYILRLRPELLTEVNASYQSPLMLAALHRMDKLLFWIFSNIECDMTTSDPEGRNPLMLLLEYGSAIMLPSVALLLERYPWMIDQCSLKMETAFSIAFKNYDRLGDEIYKLIEQATTEHSAQVQTLAYETAKEHEILGIKDQVQRQKQRLKESPTKASKASIEKESIRSDRKRTHNQLQNGSLQPLTFSKEGGVTRSSPRFHSSSSSSSSCSSCSSSSSSYTQASSSAFASRPPLGVSTPYVLDDNPAPLTRQKNQ